MSKGTLLIAGEKADAVQVMRLQLAPFAQKGYAISCETSFSAALSPDAPVPDIAVLDVGTNHAAGVALCRKLRQMGGAQKPKILIISAIKDKNTLVDSLKVGANGCVLKPYTRRVLVSKVEGFLAEAPQRITLQSGKVENREHPRKACKLAARYCTEYEHSLRKAIILDLSRGGCMLLTVENIPNDTLLALRAGDESVVKSPILAVAHTTRPSTPLEGGGRQTGCKFLKLVPFSGNYDQDWLDLREQLNLACENIRGSSEGDDDLADILKELVTMKKK